MMEIGTLKRRAAIAVVAQGERIALGRFVCDRERRQFARQLSHALAAG